MTSFTKKLSKEQNLMISLLILILIMTVKMKNKKKILKSLMVFYTTIFIAVK